MGLGLRTKSCKLRRWQALISEPRDPVLAKIASLSVKIHHHLLIFYIPIMIFYSILNSQYVRSKGGQQIATDPAWP